MKELIAVFLIFAMIMFGLGMFKAYGDANDHLVLVDMVIRCGSMKTPFSRMGYIFYVENISEIKTDSTLHGTTFGGAVKVYRQMKKNGY